jgi:hypothetical protein
MKKLIVGLLLLTSMSAYAQQDIEIIELTRPMQCAKVDDIIFLLNNKYNEIMVWVGKDQNNSSYVSIYKNKDTGSWTLIQFDSNIACILSSGNKGTPV